MIPQKFTSATLLRESLKACIAASHSLALGWVLVRKINTEQIATKKKRRWI